MGALVDAGKLTTSAIGGVATAEILSLAFGGAVGPWFLSKGSMRYKLVIISALLLVANLATYESALPYSIYLVRIAAGTLEGLLTAAMMLMIVSSRDPERSQAIYLSASTVPQVAINYALAVYLIPQFGPVSGFGVMAVLTVFGIFLSILMPAVAPHRPHKQAAHNQAWSVPILLICAVIFIHNAAIACVWYYIERLATLGGATRSEIGLSVSVFLTAQFLGATSAAFKRAPYGSRYTIFFLTILLACLSLVFPYAPSGPALLAISALFGFFQIVITPCCIRLMIWMDPEGRAVPQLTPLTLVGLSGGSFLASRVVAHDDVSSAFTAAAVLMVLAGIASVAAVIVKNRSAPLNTALG
ncbi:hypothetical protein [Sphingobium subterraneum]|uniref:Putative MFS family arabinose efflux permease n=1 Tax=Sphingobium subterraneum TaxID=627688 RepID=A0A841J6Q4_9SPHN|nr:hypothetical protein [Sphingobium subterraneum]MBB6125206.1 putative MFS family arabinose efflux permease [Sphingobium subterraneum]